MAEPSCLRSGVFYKEIFWEGAFDDDWLMGRDLISYPYHDFMNKISNKDDSNITRVEAL